MQYKKLYEKERDAAHYSQQQLASSQISLGACKEEIEKLKAAKQQLTMELSKVMAANAIVYDAVCLVSSSLSQMAEEARFNKEHTVALAMIHLASKLSEARGSRT